MNFDGSNQAQLTNGSGEYAPQIAPDNRWIVFHRKITGDPVTIWKIPFAENGVGAPSQLVGKTSSRAAVSPDSRFVAASYKEAPELPSSIIISVLEPSPNGEPPRRIEFPKGARNFVPVRWTTDGKAIVCVVNKNGADNLWLLPLDGAAARQLTNFTSDRIYNFDLSINGNHAALARGKTNSYVVMFEGLE